MANDNSIQLENMSLEELKAFHKEVTKALTTYEDRKKSEAREQLERQARELGFSLSDLTGKLKVKRTPAPPKYANPENSADTWSGRGRKPKWLSEALENGHDIEEFAINKEEQEEAPAKPKRAYNKKKKDDWAMSEEDMTEDEFEKEDS